MGGETASTGDTFGNGNHCTRFTTRGALNRIGNIGLQERSGSSNCRCSAIAKNRSSDRGRQVLTQS